MMGNSSHSPPTDIEGRNRIGTEPGWAAAREDREEELSLGLQYDGILALGSIAGRDEGIAVVEHGHRLHRHPVHVVPYASMGSDKVQWVPSSHIADVFNERLDGKRAIDEEEGERADG
uniref:Uncharacterized protein n=1 Tax=Pristionchus pacificus TaxID=54126 RepID=A0A2A6CDM0_PRIPA|eukprot:PDM76101.1 hypothetical protein PRIPAC_39705 [Pristionchus pacificus]